MPSSARTRRRRVCSAEALRHRKQTDARCAPTAESRLRCGRRKRSGIAAGLPPAGGFSPRKSPQNAPGAAAPGPLWGPAACIPRKGSSWAVTIHQTVPSHTASPFPASRGPVESAGHYGYRGFHSGRPLCLGMWQDAAHGSITTPQSCRWHDSLPSLGGCKPAVLRIISPFSP